MASKNLRRRLHHGDVDGKRHEHFETSGLDGLNEPLLGNYEYDDKHPEVSLFLLIEIPLVDVVGRFVLMLFFVFFDYFC